MYNLAFSTVVSNDFKLTFQSKTVKLNSGYEIPVLGLGTWLHKYDFENQMGDAVVYAVKKGYRVSQFSPDDGLGRGPSKNDMSADFSKTDFSILTAPIST